MADASIQRSFKLAVGHHQAGRLQEAEAIYRQILSRQADHPDALHLLGVLLHQRGNDDAAMHMLERAIALKPTVADYHSNLGSLFQSQGRWEEAIAAHRRALEIKPNYAEAYSNLGTALLETGQLDEAVDAYRWSLALRPGHARTYLGLGTALQRQDQLEEAIDACGQALAIQPDYADAHNILGAALLGLKKADEAIAEFQCAIQLRPRFPEAIFNLGVAYQLQKRLDDAIASYRQSVAFAPDHAEAHHNLGQALLGVGQWEESLHFLREAISHKPDNAGFLSDLCLALYYDSRAGATGIFAEHHIWSTRHELPLAWQILPHRNDPSPDRRLKIGYISPDLWNHPVGRFLIPLLKNHDHRQFEIFCYSDVARPDEFTQQIKGASDHWREIRGQSHEKVAERVRGDGIDILVDLAAHTSDNRLLVFARKPAPVQTTSVFTTGLRQMDYRLTDPYLDPPNQAEEFSSEKPIRLPHCIWCYSPPIPSPAVNSLPALTKGHITFGCFNNFTKVNAATLNLWLQILSAIPSSRLVLHCPAASSQAAVGQLFKAHNVSLDRLEFTVKVPPWAYYERYTKIDLCLDPFPFPGHTTTFDNLWMGVPVITLAGESAVARAGVSILSNLGLTEFIAQTPEQYLSIAKAMAVNLPRLAGVRSALRQTMQSSVLTNAGQFARDMEAAYRRMWKAWTSAHEKRPG